MTTTGHKGEHWVLRRFQPATSRAEPMEVPDDLRYGLYLDVETTGLDPATAEIIELGMVPFLFSAGEGTVNWIGGGVGWLNDPGVPIPAEVTALTGITDGDVEGEAINDRLAIAALDTAQLVIAHNANFDRRFIERRYPVAIDKPWGCSYRDIDWRGDFGAPCSTLGHLLIELCDAFSDGHRAVQDCHVGVHLLGVVKDGRTALSRLLTSVRATTFRVWATDAPFAMKDVLKLERKYRWHPGETGHRKGWHFDGDERAADIEFDWLSDQGLRPEVQRFGARERYSTRMDP